jgi:hypothetical protein
MVRNVKPTDFKYIGSYDALQKMMPFFFNDLDWIGNLAITQKVVKGIVESVQKAEQNFDKQFGGWIPASNEFGIAPLRPVLIGRPDNRWIWTTSASASSYWSAEDSFVSSHTLIDDELILIYGYFNLEPVPDTLELWIQPGNTKLPIWNIEQMRVSGKGYIIFPEPIIVEPRSQFTILASTRDLTVQATEEAGLLGYQFTPMAKLVTKKPTT